MNYTQEQLFTLWMSAPNNIPQPICQRLLAQYPNLLSNTNPVTWSGTGPYTAKFKIMDEPATVTLGPSPINGNFCILTVEQKCSQEYLPQSIKNSIKELAPEWTGTGVYTSPVVRIRMTVVTNGNPMPTMTNMYNSIGVDASFVIDFDTPTITNSTLKQTIAYRVKSTVNVLNKQGDLQ